MLTIKKLEELAAIAEAENELAIASMLHAIIGAKRSGMDFHMCNHLSTYTKEVLMPYCQNKIAEHN